MTIETKVLDRIKKMLALGNDAAATEGERETALRMAYNLLAKHNLSISDLPGDKNNEPRERQETTISADKWARSLAQSVGKLFFCNYYYQMTGVSGKDRHCFIGRQSNVMTATYMAEFLIKAVKKEASKRYKSPTSPEGRSFCVGTTSTIRKRVEEMIKCETESTPGTALVLVKMHETEKQANAMWLDGIGIRTSIAKSRQDNSLVAGAFHDGKSYGKTVSLNQQVGSGATRYKQLT